MLEKGAIVDQLSQDDQTPGEKKERVALAEAVCHEMQLYLENPILYRSDHSTLIALSIGLASLDLPVLLVTIISECLVSINEEKLFGQYSEQKSWILQH